MTERRTLELRVLGDLAVVRDGAPVALPPSKKTRALLAYLAVTGRPHRRDRLCSLLWDIPDDPRGALRWSLSKLRPLVDAPDRARIVADRETVAFDGADAAVDLFAVRAELAAGLEDVPTERLRDLADAFRGEFLEGLELPDLHDFQAWCVAEREEARAMHARLLRTLVERLAASPAEALPYARALVAVDPYDEPARTTLVRLLAAAGRRGEAEQQAATGLRLADETGAAPSGALREARQALRRAPQPAAGPDPAPAPAPALAPAPAREAPPVAPTAVPQPAGEAERKQLTILFADIKGSTEMIDGLDPEVALRRLDPALQAMIDAVHRYDGTVNRVQGDGIMALFGAPRAHEDDAVRACFAALAMRDAVHAVSGGELAIRVGLNSGEVVVRLLGNDKTGHYDAVGVVVHLASRVEQMVAPGTVGLTAETARRAERFIKTRPLGALPVKGVQEPVALFELTGHAPARSRRESWAIQGLTQFVGREAELAKMTRALERAGTGRGEVVAIVGEPGMGKSRLVYQFLRSPATEDWMVLETVAISHDVDATYMPIANLLRSWIGAEKNDTPAEIAAKVRARIVDLDEDCLVALTPVSALLGVPVEDAEWAALTALQRRRRTINAVKALFLRQSQERPLILAVDNLNWVDEESRAVLANMVDVLAGYPILLLITFRPEFRHDWAAKSYFRLIRADPLPAASAVALSKVLLGDDGGLEALRRLLIRKTEGNPLFLEESVRDLAETGALEGTPGRYRLARPVDDFAIAPTIQAVLAARIDRLAPAAKNLLQMASVIGKEFPVALLREIAGLSEEALDDLLAQLQGAEFIYESRLLPEAEFSFKHALTHAVTYGNLLHERRRANHADVVRAIERRYHNRLDRQIERLAQHALAGELWDEAVEYCLQAAEKTKRQHAYRLALQFVSTARAVAEKHDASDAHRIAALVLSGDMNSRIGELEAANACYEAAIALETTAAGRRAIENKHHRQGIAVRDGARIAYYEHGRGAATLLFVNPIVYGLDVFQPILERLCQEFHIITLDPRGTGSSDALQRPYRLRDHAADVRAVLEEAGVGPIIGVGISRGANLLAHLAHTHPQLVDKLVFVGGLADLGTTDSPAPRTDYLATVARLVAADDLEGLVRYHMRRVFSEPDTQDLIEETFERLLRLPRETLLSFYDEDPDMEIRPILKELRVPTLVMHGTEDQQVPFAAGQYLASAVPGAEFYAFQGAGHLPVFTAMDEFCQAVRRFAGGAAGGKTPRSATPPVPANRPAKR